MQKARENDIDLIVMGYHACGRLEQAIAGSIGRSVLRRVNVTVLLVKLPESS